MDAAVAYDDAAHIASFDLVNLLCEAVDSGSAISPAFVEDNLKGLERRDYVFVVYHLLERLKQVVDLNILLESDLTELLDDEEVLTTALQESDRRVKTASQEKAALQAIVAASEAELDEMKEALCDADSKIAYTESLLNEQRESSKEASIRFSEEKSALISVLYKLEDALSARITTDSPRDSGTEEDDCLSKEEIRELRSDVSFLRSQRAHLELDLAQKQQKIENLTLDLREERQRDHCAELVRQMQSQSQELSYLRKHLFHVFKAARQEKLREYIKEICSGNWKMAPLLSILTEAEEKELRSAALVTEEWRQKAADAQQRFEDAEIMVKTLKSRLASRPPPSSVVSDPTPVSVSVKAMETDSPKKKSLLRRILSGK